VERLSYSLPSVVQGCPRIFLALSVPRRAIPEQVLRCNQRVAMVHKHAPCRSTERNDLRGTLTDDLIGSCLFTLLRLVVYRHVHNKSYRYCRNHDWPIKDTLGKLITPSPFLRVRQVACRDRDFRPCVPLVDQKGVEPLSNIEACASYVRTWSPEQSVAPRLHPIGGILT
jgi:hypothetical protein